MRYILKNVCEIRYNGKTYDNHKLQDVLHFILTRMRERMHKSHLPH